MLRPTFHIQPDSKPASSAALFELSSHYCSFALLDTSSKKLVEFAHYEKEKGREQFVQSVLKNHGVSGLPVGICYWSNTNILVPSSHFRVQDAASQIELISGSNNSIATLTEQVSDWEVHNIYRMPSDITDAAEALKARQYWHHDTIWLKNQKHSSSAVLCDFRSDEFSVIVTKGSQLLLSCIYTYSNPADVMFHLLKIFSVFDLSQRDIAIYVSGFIDENSALMKELHKYFLHATFAEPANGITLDDSFADYPSHFFNSISNLAACVSSEVH